MRGTGDRAVPSSGQSRLPVRLRLPASSSVRRFVHERTTPPRISVTRRLVYLAHPAYSWYLWPYGSTKVLFEAGEETAVNGTVIAGLVSVYARADELVR